MSVFIISPHFDDAVLSTWSVIAQNNVHIITVCGGVPGSSIDIASSDKNCGFTSAAEAALCRRREDVSLCEYLNVEYVHMNELDYPYAHNKNSKNIENEISKYVTSKDIVYVPIGIGKHPDHILSRNIMINILKKIKYSLIFYADYPYASVKSSCQDKYNWDIVISEVKDKKVSLKKKETIVLNEKEIHEKIRCVQFYKSQMAMLQKNYPELLRTPGILYNEHFWRVDYD